MSYDIVQRTQYGAQVVATRRWLWRARLYARLRQAQGWFTYEVVSHEEQ